MLLRLFAVISVTFLAIATASAETAKTIVVPIGALNGTAESGSATLRAMGNQTEVVVQLANAPSEKQPAHFHIGTCDKYQPRPLYPLKDLVNGQSTTILDVPLDQLTAGNLILNVHKSYSDIATQAACGIAKA